MNHSEVVKIISELCKTEKCPSTRVKKVQTALGNWTIDKLSDHLEYAGIIPETYDHDSSEEKFYAKYCDILLYAFFGLYGMKSELVQERANAPDVIGTLGNKYKIVADAKAFRLSRTALNPKDYKIDRVDQWRKKASANYACVVASLLPGNRSSLFQEAVNRNVTLLTYPQLLYIISDPKWVSVNLEPLWKISDKLPSKGKIAPGEYTATVESWLQKNIKSNISLKILTTKYWKNVTKEGVIIPLEEKKKQIGKLSREELEKLAVEEIDNKIENAKLRIEKIVNNYTSKKTKTLL